MDCPRPLPSLWATWPWPTLRCSGLVSWTRCIQDWSWSTAIGTDATSPWWHGGAAGGAGLQSWWSSTVLNHCGSQNIQYHSWYTGLQTQHVWTSLVCKLQCANCVVHVFTSDHVSVPTKTQKTQNKTSYCTDCMLQSWWCASTTGAIICSSWKPHNQADSHHSNAGARPTPLQACRGVGQGSCILGLQVAHLYLWTCNSHHCRLYSGRQAMRKKHTKTITQ